MFVGLVCGVGGCLGVGWGECLGWWFVLCGRDGWCVVGGFCCGLWVGGCSVWFVVVVGWGGVVVGCVCGLSVLRLCLFLGFVGGGGGCCVLGGSWWVGGLWVCGWLRGLGVVVWWVWVVC